MAEPIESLELTPFRRLIDDVQGLLGQHWRPFVAGMVGPLLITGLFGVVIQRFQLQLADPNAIDPGQLFLFLGTTIVLSVGIVGAYALTFNAALLAAVDAVEGRPVSMARSWRFVLRPKVLLTQAVVTFVMMASFMLCLVPAVYMVPRLTYVIPAMSLEGLGARAAIRRSAELIHFNPTGRLRDSSWLQTFVVLVLGVVLYYAVVTLVQLPLTLVMLFLMFRNGVFDGSVMSPEDAMVPLWLQLPMIVVSALATAFSWLYWVFASAALYRELRRRKEGEDLQEAIDRLTRPGSAPGDLDALPGEAPIGGGWVGETGG